MIVRTFDDGSMILINQTDHARLSGQFSAHWGNATFATPARRESVIRAAMFHDNGWLRYETEPAYEVATKTSPSFFQSPVTRTQLAAFGWAIDWLSDIDAYAGLLISRHRTGLYRQRYGAVQEPASAMRRRDEPLIDAFVAQYEAKQEQALAQFSRREARTDYRLLQFWDLLSLALCLRDPREERFALVPTSTDDEDGAGVAITMAPQGDGAIRLDPFPFDARGIELGYVYRRLPHADFASESAFRAAYFAAAPILRRFTFV